MWLGLFAVVVAFSYALIKFVTSVHMRRLREVRGRLFQDVKRERQRLTSIEGKLQVERSRNGAAQQKLNNARRFKDDLFSRLRIELPSSMVADLRQCVNRHPIPEPAGVKTAHDLRLADKVSQALGSLSLLIVEFGDDEGGGGKARTVLEGELVQDLTAREIRFSGPQQVRSAEEDGPTRLTTAFDGPDDAIATIRSLARLHPQEILRARAALVAGVSMTEFDQEHVNRLFARTFHGAWQLLEDTPAGALVVNGQAYEQLRDRDGVQEHRAPENLWILPLSAADDDEQDGAAAEVGGAEAADAQNTLDADAASPPAEAQRPAPTDDPDPASSADPETPRGAAS